MAAQSCLAWHAISAGFAWSATLHTQTKSGIYGKSKNIRNWFRELLEDYRRGAGNGADSHFHRSHELTLFVIRRTLER